MMIGMGRIFVALSFMALFLFSGQTWSIAADGSVAAPPISSIEQALGQVTSEDESIRDAAIRLLIEQGDDRLVIRAGDAHGAVVGGVGVALGVVHAETSLLPGGKRGGGRAGVGTQPREVCTGFLATTRRCKNFPNRWHDIFGCV